MLTHLSNLLRKTLKGGEGLIHTINEEVNLVRAYLELEGLRFEERLQVKWEIDESLLDATVPSLLVQTLVENSIKHGISTLPQEEKFLFLYNLGHQALLNSSSSTTGS